MPFVCCVGSGQTGLCLGFWRSIVRFRVLRYGYFVLSVSVQGD